MKKTNPFTTAGIAIAAAASIVSCAADDDKKKEAKDNPTPVVEIDTSMGKIQIELNRKKAPITVDNFLSYVEKKTYDKTIFHRVMDGFMIQGGGFEQGEKDAAPLEKKTDAPIKNEARISGLKNEAYTIAMARTNLPDSATNQFFINVNDNTRSLDPNSRNPAGYAVFGKVISGKETVDKIKGCKTGLKKLTSRHRGQTHTSVHENVPLKEVVIKSIRLVDKKKGDKKDKKDDAKKDDAKKEEKEAEKVEG